MSTPRRLRARSAKTDEVNRGASVPAPEIAQQQFAIEPNGHGDGIGEVVERRVDRRFEGRGFGLDGRTQCEQEVARRRGVLLLVHNPILAPMAGIAESRLSLKPLSIEEP